MDPPRSLPRSTTVGGSVSRFDRFLAIKGLCIGQLGVLATALPAPDPPLPCLSKGRPLHQKTSRSFVRWGRCSGPHPSHGGKLPGDRPFCCFQCGGHHGLGLPTALSTRRPTTVRQAGSRKGCPFPLHQTVVCGSPTPRNSGHPPPSRPPHYAIPYGCIATQGSPPRCRLFLCCQGENRYTAYRT
ncbi:hypothetical protein GWK47_040980 [Chionoecetes opilio]|uniref:Uncharacterized protein n=1 Tax=Chionoecetes opilio TaxID=41210 RepID=A0A8J4YBL9_CHIOP|nr:hypothetical protein GWK47_040980 [Chionoecetes opilio]